MLAPTSCSALMVFSFSCHGMFSVWCGVDRARSLGRVEEMDLEIAQPDIDFLHLASFELLIGRFDSFHNLTADDFGVEFHGLV
ncbi:MAG: hypothetical protein U1E51_33275 [Candidatus Binatia bacterium]|nr:hypothetical protein [Candidatus Binatia bacterium]